MSSSDASSCLSPIQIDDISCPLLDVVGEKVFGRLADRDAAVANEFTRRHANGKQNPTRHRALVGKTDADQVGGCRRDAEGFNGLVERVEVIELLHPAGAGRFWSCRGGWSGRGTVQAQVLGDVRSGTTVVNAEDVGGERDLISALALCKAVIRSTLD